MLNVLQSCKKFEEMQQPDLLWLPTDHALLESPEYRPYFMQYAESQELFFKDYTAAHIKMSELGAKFGNEVVTLERRTAATEPTPEEPTSPVAEPKKESAEEKGVEVGKLSAYNKTGRELRVPRL